MVEESDMLKFFEKTFGNVGYISRKRFLKLNKTSTISSNQLEQKGKYAEISVFLA